MSIILNSLQKQYAYIAPIIEQKKNLIVNFVKKIFLTIFDKKTYHFDDLRAKITSLIKIRTLSSKTEAVAKSSINPGITQEDRIKWANDPNTIFEHCW